MSAAAKPFSFDEFSDGLEAEPAEKTYSRVELEAARKEGSVEALAGCKAEELRKQTQLIADIVDRLDKEAAAHRNMMKTQAALLVGLVRDFVKAVAVGAAAQDKGENAIALIERYLACAHDLAQATLLISGSAPKSLAAQLKKEIKARGGAGAAINVETSKDITPGDARLEWRDGAITREAGNVLAQIDALFAGVQNDVAHQTTLQETAP